ncbi:MAG TPA: formate dehydrogenase subunit gamma [Burkholderiales bacterium]|nr:formate dehydrogenase subunit gamma [Burkholderiales bacterium]
MNKPANSITRHPYEDRVVHWLIALGFVLAGLSGLAFFHPATFFFSDLFGGGTWSRILHPFFGLMMFVCFAFYAAKVWRHNVVDERDKQWLAKAGEVMAGREDGIPEAGRYNAGQKVLFWLLLLCMLALLPTGIVFWRPYFADLFPIGLVRLSTLLHSVIAIGLILLVIGHVYMAIWTKGSIRAMTQGWVTRAWARKHHPAWYREMTR